MSTRIGMVAGEASGDLLAASVLQYWQQQKPRQAAVPPSDASSSDIPSDPAPGEAASAPDVMSPASSGNLMQTAGIGGPRMQAAGFDAWWPSDLLAVHGYAEAFKVLPKLLWIRRQLAQRLLDWPARGFIGVDAPDFNLGLETRLRAAGVRTWHFVSPSIWAWRRERIEKIRQAADHMLLIFPFEEAIYREAGIPATYCGHPLADQIPFHPDQGAARAELGLAAQGTVIALMPGSRHAEVEHLAPVFLAAAVLLHRQHPDWHFILPAAGDARHAQLRALIDTDPAWQKLPLQLLHGQSHTALAACDQTLIASGTATLEAALYKRPMVIAYRMSPFSYRLMKGRNYQPWFGLPNILAGEFLVPEFIQDAATPEGWPGPSASSMTTQPAATVCARALPPCTTSWLATARGVWPIP